MVAVNSFSALLSPSARALSRAALFCLISFSKLRMSRCFDRMSSRRAADIALESDLTFVTAEANSSWLASSSVDVAWTRAWFCSSSSCSRARSARILANWSLSCTSCACLLVLSAPSAFGIAFSSFAIRSTNWFSFKANESEAFFFAFNSAFSLSSFFLFAFIASRRAFSFSFRFTSSAAISSLCCWLAFSNSSLMKRSSFSRAAIASFFMATLFSMAARWRSISLR
mmetsp:Transcript_43144/g.63269  ORF Transcript_43144/g.63269 Transcript_43144/m.63269 type:complete len:227 (-) Transcript_43144:2979-3659(-)